MFNSYSKKTLYNNDGSRSKTFDPGQVGSIFVTRFGSAIYVLGLGLENFP